MGVEVLVLDEADALMDGWFRSAVEDIFTVLPPAAQRQSMLFSATFPEAVTELTRFALRENYTDVNTVLDEVTPEQIDQSYTVAATEEMNEVLWAALQRAATENPEHFKVIVFLTSARVA